MTENPVNQPCEARNDEGANFEDFLNDRPEKAPFCFWYGATEPHRRYQDGAGKAR